MFQFLFLAACSNDKETDEAEFLAPDIWGVEALEDINPDPNIVEVVMEASATSKVIGGASVSNVWTYNGLTPGPLLQAKKGDNVIIHFTNNLETATTIHWHGLRIPEDMDGTPAVQTPVEPGEEFTYEFVVPDSGSYWYHPHMRSNEAVERGLQGSIIIHEPTDPVVETERFFVLDDLYLNSSNDFGSFEIGHMESVHGREGNNLLANGQSILDEPLTDTVAPGKTERWRIVNTANARTMWIDVEGAAWRVIAIDGTTLEEPYKTAEAQLPVGRRFDLEVIPDSDYEEVQLQILLPDQSGNFDRYPAFVAAIEGEAGENSWKEWPTDSLPEASIDNAEQEISLEFNGTMGNDGIAVWTINGETYSESEAITVQGNTPSLIRITDKSGASHPYHLHGEFFQILERSSGEILPGQMDTLLIEGDEEVVLWTEFSNIGHWMSHCHILEHAEQGMMGEIVVE